MNMGVRCVAAMHQARNVFEKFKRLLKFVLLRLFPDNMLSVASCKN